ncbi:uncharacterized protein VTP21DRAFT_11717 [Calcarisporiella thermophila]|uniref:uncharacterized protein n=1 Tax=Calcarisporiella thermophila TaxID=911321 RepID=UPI003744547D
MHCTCSASQRTLRRTSSRLHTSNLAQDCATTPRPPTLTLMQPRRFPVKFAASLRATGRRCAALFFFSRASPGPVNPVRRATANAGCVSSPLLCFWMPLEFDSWSQTVTYAYSLMGCSSRVAQSNLPLDEITDPRNGVAWPSPDLRWPTAVPTMIAFPCLARQYEQNRYCCSRQRQAWGGGSAQPNLPPDLHRYGERSKASKQTNKQTVAGAEIRWQTQRRTRPSLVSANKEVEFLLSPIHGGLSSALSSPLLSAPLTIPQ